MDPRLHLQAFIDAQGGLPAAAKALNTEYQTLRGIHKGWRGVTREMAAKWAAASGGLLDASVLIWIRPTRKLGDAISREWHEARTA